MQDKSEAKAAAMPESKRWIDPALIQRNWEANEVAQAAEQARRQQAVVDGNKRMVSALNKQLADKAARAREHAETEKKHSDAYLQTAGAAEERALEERRKRMQLKLQVPHLICPQAGQKASFSLQYGLRTVHAYVYVLRVPSGFDVQTLTRVVQRAGQAGARGSDARQRTTPP